MILEVIVKNPEVENDVGEEFLRRKSIEIEDIEQYEDLILDMFLTLESRGGVGIAAPQVGQSLRLFVLNIEPLGERVFINPRIVESGPDFKVFAEGCLSLPDKIYYTLRPEWVKVKALDENGDEFELILKDTLGCAVQHECDHFDGILAEDRHDPELRQYIDDAIKDGAI